MPSINSNVHRTHSLVGCWKAYSIKCLHFGTVTYPAAADIQTSRSSIMYTSGTLIYMNTHSHTVNPENQNKASLIVQARIHSISYCDKLAYLVRVCRSMAENTVKKFEEELNCSICLDIYTDPKLLQCFHAYCRKCLVKLVERDQQGQLILTCPICRHDTPVPANGVAGLQPAFQINHFLEIMEEHKKAAADPSSSAEKTERNSASLTSRDKVKVCCREHAEREVELFCETCGELVCVKCVIKGGKHQSHDCEELDKSFERYKVDITASLKPMEKQVTTITKAPEANGEASDHHY